MFLIKLCRGAAGGLSEVRAHVALKVEVGKLILIGKLEKLLKLAICENATSVSGVLKRMGTDVSINLASDLCACHLGSLRLSRNLETQH